jgi:WXG100 family type VII secretion target
MPSLRVAPEQLQTLSSTVLKTAGDVRGAQHQLKSQLSPLFGSDWSGQASAQFASLYEQFDSHAQGLTQALDGIGQLLRNAGAAYADVESQIASSFR